MSITWDGTAQAYFENGQRAYVIYLNFNALAVDNNVPANNVVYTNTALTQPIDPNPSKDTAVIMDAIQNLVKKDKNGNVESDKGADICDALNARNVSFYDQAGKEVKLVYVNTTVELTNGHYSTIHIGKNNKSKDATVTAAVNDTNRAVALAEVTGNSATEYAGDTAFAKGFVFTDYADDLTSKTKADNWTTADVNTMVKIIDRVGNRLAGNYSGVEGTLDITDFQDTMAACNQEVLYWKRNPRNTTDKGKWISYENGGAEVKVILLDFDGVEDTDSVFYKNEAMGITAGNNHKVTGTAAITDSTKIQAIVDALNAADSNYLYITDTKSLSAANGKYNTIYVGNLDGLPNADTAKYATIAETTAGLKDDDGNLIWQKSFGSGYVLTQNMALFSNDKFVEAIQRAAKHVTGRTSHDDGGDGPTLDDFYENDTKVRVIYLDFSGLDVDDRTPENNVVYTNEALKIAPTPSKNTAVVMKAIQNLSSAQKDSICSALNARNVSYYDEQGNLVKLVYVTDPTVLGDNYSTIYIGKADNNKDETITSALAANAVSITEVTGNPSTVYAGDTAYAKGFVFTNHAGLHNDTKTDNWDDTDINTLVSIIDRAGTRLSGIYTCADGVVDTITDFQDTKAECDKQIIFWEKNPVDDTDKGHWIVYEGGEKLTKKVIVLDFDGITAADGVKYTNEALNITAADGYNVTGSAAITDAARIQGIIDTLNNAQSEYQFMANTSALSVANGQYNTIYVGNLTGLPGEGAKYTSIAETTAGLEDDDHTLIWQKSFGSGYVLVQNMMDKSDAKIVEFIQNAVGHVTGTYSHDDGKDGPTLDDFYEGIVTGPSGETWDPTALGGKGAFVDEEGAIRYVQLVFDDANTTYTNVNDDLMSQDPGSRAWRQFNYKNIPVTMTGTITDTTVQQTICATLNAMGEEGGNLTFTKTVGGVDYTVKIKFVIGTSEAPVTSTLFIGKNSNRSYGTGSDGFKHWLTGLPMEQCYLASNSTGTQTALELTGYSSIVEASGENVDELFANGFVLTESSPTTDELISYIKTAAMHLMGEYSHDYGHNGVTIDDFYESFQVPGSTISSAIGSPEKELGGILKNVVIDGQSLTSYGLFFCSDTEICTTSQSSASYDHGIRSQEAYVLNSTFTNNIAQKTITSDNKVTVPAPIIYAGRISAVTIDNSNFTGNQTGCIFVDNKCGHSGHNARITVGNAVFSANTTTNSTGGIVDIEVGGNLYMGNSQITGNVIAGTNTSADGYGATIYATQKSDEGDVNVYLEGSTFSGNTAAVEGFSRAVYVDQGLAAQKGKTAYENYLFLDNTTFADKNQRVVSLGQVNMRDTNTFAADFYNDPGHTVTFTTETDEEGKAVPAVMKFANQDEIFVDAKMDTSEGNAQVILDGSDTVNFGSWVASTASSAADLASKLNADGTHKTLDEMETLIGGDFDNKFTALDLNEADVIINQETPFEEAEFELGASHAYSTGISLSEDVENVFYNGSTAAASLKDIDELQMMNKKRDVATGEHYDFGKLAYVVNYTMMAEAATAFSNIWFNMGKQDLDNKYFVGQNTYQEAFHDRRATIIAGNNKVTNGGSINEGGAEMILEGTLFADEYSFELNNLTWDGSLYGGSKDTLRDDTKGTDLIINGVTFSGTNTLIVGGGQNCGTGTGDINVIINDSKFDKTATIFGAGETTETAIVTGNVTLAIKAKNHDNLARIYAGGYASGANASITTGDIATTFTAENAERQFGAFYGGAMLENGASFNAGTITTVINGGNFLSFVGNGSKTTNGNGQVTSTIDATSLSISGGTFANLVYAGGYSNGDKVTVEGDSTLTITGGTFNKSVFGGCGANNDDNGTLTTITGDVNVTVTATADSAVVFNSNLYAASMGAGQIAKSTYLTVTGDGEYLTFDDASFVTGNSRLGEHIGSTEKVYVTDDRVLTFKDFTGDFGGNMSSGFSKLVFEGSTVSFTGATKVDLQFANTWEFEIGGTNAILTWDGVANSDAFVYNNFSKDTLTLSFDEDFTLASGSSATIIQGCDNTLRNWDKFGSVTLGGAALTFDKDAKAYLGTFDEGSYKLYMDDASKSLILSHLAS